MTNSDTRPAIVVTRAMTMANRGRSTKKGDKISLTPVQRPRRRGPLYRHARTQRLKTLDDDVFATRQTLGHDHRVAVWTAGGDAPHRCLAVIDNKDVDPLLVGDQCG